MSELGLFRGKRAVLLSGKIYEMAGQANWHSVGIGLVDNVLREVFSKDRYWVRPQLPLELPDDVSEPEPDLAVVEGTPDDFLQHPKTAILVVEISDSSLRLDRKKAAYYAAAGVPEYWIVNLRDRLLEVHREPAGIMPGGWPPEGPPDARYSVQFALKIGESISPVADPQASIAIADLFPARPSGDTF